MTLQMTNPTWSPARSLAIRVHLERSLDNTGSGCGRVQQLTYALDLLAIARHEITREPLASKLQRLIGEVRAAICDRELWRAGFMITLLADLDATSERESAPSQLTEDIADALYHDHWMDAEAG